MLSEQITIQTLGAFGLIVRGQTVEGLTRKARGIIGYLALSDEHRETRDRLIGLLWSESSDERARASLRQALYAISETLARSGLDGLAADKHSIWIPWTGVRVDAMHLLDEAEAGRDFAFVADPASNLLRDLDSVDPAFDEWLASRRQSYGVALTGHLEATLKLAESNGVHRETVARTLAMVDPANEEAARSLIRARANAGDVGAALGIYRALWDRLGEDFDVEPSKETQELIAGIKLAQPLTLQSNDAKKLNDAPTPIDRHGSPSLAVLPFVNMSGDPQQEYFADGITEDIITTLSRVKWFFVIARNSSFSYRGKSVDVRRIGRELGVRYILEGSVRKAGSQLRITGQLVEAETGRHVWAEKFDGNLDDVFALQDRVAEAVAINIEPSLRKAELERSRIRPTENLQAYDFVLRALPNITMTNTRATSDDAISNLKSAIALDPSYAQALGLLGTAHALRRGEGWSTMESEREGLLAAERVIALQSDDPIALASAANALGFLGRRHHDATGCADRAYALNPNSSRVLIPCGWVNFYAGRDSIAATLFERHLLLSPVDPESGYIHGGLAMALFALHRCDEGLRAARLAVAAAPRWSSAQRALIINLVEVGLIEEARKQMLILRELAPHLTVRSLPRVHVGGEYADRYDAAMRTAGLPE